MPDFDIKDKKKSIKDRIYNVHLKYEKVEDDGLINLSTSSLPTKVDLSESCKLIYDQRSIGSCTANACSWAYYYQKRSFLPSRLFLYYYSRLYDQQNGDNSVKIDDGSTLESAVRTLKNKGVCPEGRYPYIIRKYGKRPPPRLSNIAVNNRIISFSKIAQNINSMKQCLANNKPFVFGIYVFDSYESSYTDRTGILTTPNTRTESFLGGHAICAVGYDDEKQLIKFANSYGKSWGDEGFGYIPYNYILNPDLADDMWVINEFFTKRLNNKSKINNNKKKSDKRVFTTHYLKMLKVKNIYNMKLNRNINKIGSKK